jgi:hypothetical protein
MPKRSLRSCALSALACWLVLLASADDFNFARLVLPPSAADSGGTLPLDDPNTDFTQSPQSPGPTATPRDRLGCRSSVGQSLVGVAPPPFAAAADGHPPRRGSNAPLRC